MCAWPLGIGAELREQIDPADTASLCPITATGQACLGMLCVAAVLWVAGSEMCHV